MTNDLIVLQKYIQRDFPEYYSLVNKDSVMRYVSGRGLTLKEAEEKFESIIKINKEEIEIGYFKIYNQHGQFIGDGKLEKYKRDSTQLEIGYLLKEEFWGQGYGTAICTQLLSLAEKIGPTTAVLGIIDPDNIASKKLLEKFGFKSIFVGIEDNLPTEKLILCRN